MADDADIAAERSAQLLQDAIAAAARLSHAQREPVSACENCGTPLPEAIRTAAGRYCDADCRDDHQARQRAEARR